MPEKLNLSEIAKKDQDNYTFLKLSANDLDEAEDYSADSEDPEDIEEYHIAEEAYEYYVKAGKRILEEHGVDIQQLALQEDEQRKAKS